MRTMAIVLVLAAIAAAPGALALEETTVEAPDARVHVDAIDVGAPQTGAQTPVALVGGVHVQETDVSLSETRCELDADVKMAEAERARCTPGQFATSREATQIVTADLALAFAAASAAPEAEPAALQPQAAMADALPSGQSVVLAAAAAGASLAGLYAVWRVLKWTGIAAFLPLYSHITDDEILDDPNRAGIYRLIQAEPGISTKDVADRLDLAWGTVTHHLGKLEKRRFVVSKKYGKYRRYFANGAGGTDQKDAVAVLRLDRTGDVAALIQQNPGVTQKAVSNMLGVSSSTILWHVKRLEEVRLVRKVREGKMVRYYPGEGLPGVAVIAPASLTTAA